LLGDRIIDEFGSVVDQVMPQSAIFLCGTIFQDFVSIQKRDPNELPAVLFADSENIIRAHLERILIFAKENPNVTNKSWPSLLKSMAFFNHVMAFMRGLQVGERKNGGSHP
jgi:hypothetical protein